MSIAAPSVVLATGSPAATAAADIPEHDAASSVAVGSGVGGDVPSSSPPQADATAQSRKGAIRCCDRMAGVMSCLLFGLLTAERKSMRRGLALVPGEGA
jgi:hypothetical protein